VPPNGLGQSCPAEAGNLGYIVRRPGGPGKQRLRPSPPGQPKGLMTLQGFSELLGAQALH